jgi:hypothetical protein
MWVAALNERRIDMQKFIVMHDIDIADFIQTLDKCRGDVFLETEEGDVLNLKSKLCQMIGVANILKDAIIKEVTIRCTNPEDESLLFRFNLYKEVPKSNDEDEEDE